MFVLLHGMIGSAAHWDGLRDHLPGGGGSDCYAPEIDYAAHALDDLAAHLRRQITGRTSGPVVLCGNSIGCVLALRLHDLADAVVLAAPPLDYDNAPLPLRRSDLRPYIDTLVQDTDQIADLDRHRDAALRKVGVLTADRAGLRAIRRLKADCQSILTDPRLTQAQDKLTMVIGGADYTTPEAAMRAFLRRRAPAARLRVLPGRGHTLPLEAPVDLARILEDAACPVLS